MARTAKRGVVPMGYSITKEKKIRADNPFIGKQLNLRGITSQAVEALGVSMFKKQITKTTKKRRLSGGW